MINIYKFSLKGLPLFLILIIGIFLGIISTSKFAVIILMLSLAIILILYVLNTNPLITWRYVMMFIMMHTLVILHLMPSIFNISDNIVSLLKIWKEVIFIFSSIFILINKKKNRYHSGFNNTKEFYVLVLIYIIIMITSTFNTTDIKINIYGFRNYLIGFGILILFMNLHCTSNDIYIFVRKLGGFVTLISLWGIFQAKVLGSQFLTNLGYGEGGVLEPSFYISYFYGKQRVCSTFASPNTFASVVVIFVLFYFADIIILGNKTRLNFICFSIIFTSLVLSYSRSCLLGFFVGAIVILYFKYGRKIISYTILLFSFFAFIAILINILPTKSSSMIVTHILNTFTLKDTSIVGHYDSIIYSFKFIFDNVTGLGVGFTGPKSSKFFADILNSESSYFVIAYDIGILGLIIYLFICGSIIKNIESYKQNKDLKIRFMANYLVSCWLATLLAYLFLPLFQELEHIFILYSFTGMLFAQNRFN